MREAALCLLVDLERDSFPAAGRLERDEMKFPRVDDRHLFRSLVLESLRHRSRLDWVLEHCLNRPLKELTPWIRNLLRLGATQLLLLPRIQPYAVVDTAATLGARYGHRGTAGLINAVLRRVGREGQALWEAATAKDPLESLALRTSHPLWLVRRWVSRYGLERTERILEWNNAPPDYWLRLRPGAEPPEPARPGWIPGSARLPARSRPAQLPGFDQGRFTVQDGSGILVGLLPPRVRGRILDACAAPGTKTGHLAERAEPDTTLIALDQSPGRLKRLRQTLRRLDRSALVIAADARRLPLRTPWDGVLLDAPCSNLGVIRRRIDLKWRAREEAIAELGEVQSAALSEVAGGVAPGGWLVYSVCTLEPEETGAVRDRFFREHPEWRPLAHPEAIPEQARGREGEMVLLPGELETDGGYAFLAQKER